MIRLFPALLAAALAAPAQAEPPQRPASFSPEVIRVEGIPPERVQLSVSVLDRDGEPVRGLQRADFLVEEDGAPHELVDFGRESDRQDRPLSAVFLVDRSGSIGRQFGRWRQACAALASALRPIDEVRVATFASELSVLQDFTRDPGLLARAVERIDPPAGGTDLFGAIDGTLHDLRDRPGRKVIFLLTDGLDSRHAALWNMDGAPYLSGLLRRAVSFHVTVVTILPGPTARPFLAAQDLALRTGGWWLYPSDDLPALVRNLGQRLLESYYLAYDSTRKPGEPRRGRVKVTVVRPGLPEVQIRTVDAVFGDAPLIEALEEDLREGQEENRHRAAIALGLMAGPEAVRPLLRALKDDSPKVRGAAVEALTTLLRRQTDEAVRARILDALEETD